MNNNNFGIFNGRLVKEPVYFENSDGSSIVLLTVACQQNFASGKAHEYQSDFIEFRGFIPKRRKGNGIYDYVSTGDKISISYSLRSSASEKGGKKTFYQSPFIESVQLLESKTVREERRARKNA